MWPVGAQLGEGPIWHAAEEAVWFVDIKGQQIHRFHEPSGATQSWKAPAQPGFVLPAKDGSMIAGLEDRPASVRSEDRRVQAARSRRAETCPNNRLNDGFVAADG